MRIPQRRPVSQFVYLGVEQRFLAEAARIATSGGTAPERGVALLGLLECLVPYDAAWIALRDPETGRHVPLVQQGRTAALQAYFAESDADEELQRLGLHHFGWPVLAHDLPIPMEHTRAWGEYLLPAGFRDGLGVSLFTCGGRHVGFMCLLTEDPAVFTATTSAVIHGMNGLIAAAVDSLPPGAAPAAQTDDGSDASGSRQ